MKSFTLFKLFLLAIFVISVKANTKDQVNAKLPIAGGGFKVWLNEVKGYDKNDAAKGYAGILGEVVTSIRISGGTAYRVHLLNEKKWLGKIKANNQTDPNGYAGAQNGKAIDAFVVGGGVEYAAHIKGGGWLDPVTGYNLTDPKNGYAGIFGKPIDAIMIKGRTYAVSYNDVSKATNKCAVEGGTCMNPKDCKGTVLTGLCPGGADNKCCVPEEPVNDNATEGSTDPTIEDPSNASKLNAFGFLAFMLMIMALF